MKRWRWGFVALLLALALAGCARSDFNLPATIDSVEQALTAHGLHICATEPLSWTSVAELVVGHFLSVSTDCAKPGAKVAIAQFGSVEARDAAMSNILHASRTPGNRTARTLGPLVITIERVDDNATMQSVLETLNALGAK
jgi:hypothetical protein